MLVTKARYVAPDISGVSKSRLFLISGVRYYLGYVNVAHLCAEFSHSFVEDVMLCVFIVLKLLGKTGRTLQGV